MPLYLQSQVQVTRHIWTLNKWLLSFGGNIFLQDSNQNYTVAHPPLSVVSLSTVSVTCGQPRSENIKLKTPEIIHKF